MRIFDEYPHELLNNSMSGLYLFTPDLSRFVSFDQRTKSIIVKKTMDPNESEEGQPSLKIENLMLAKET